MGQFNIGFVPGFADRVYPSSSFDWIRERARDITDVAQTIGVSAGSVAGIMAEERKSAPRASQMRTSLLHASP